MTEPSQRNIVLTGFMATGKTTIGRVVAALLAREFVDTDIEIMHRTKLNIPQIFEQYGEPGFRKLETVMCKWLATRGGLVVATGGGMLVNVHNLAAMTQTGLVVCLHAPLDVIARRLANNPDRPLAADWEMLYEQRRAAYAAIPHHVDTAGKAPHDVAEEVIALWRLSQ
ncbi:MAG: shikimate kinase [Armatimonadetes bacterium]|nr:shikimate kinase [Anaerolineae bacterium]